jgi:hypothetical protein
MWVIAELDNIKNIEHSLGIFYDAEEVRISSTSKFLPSQKFLADRSSLFCVLAKHIPDFRISHKKHAGVFLSSHTVN